MEEKSISFGFGIQRSPSLATQSGELSEAVNLIPKNGELVNIKPPVALEGITHASGTFRYVHNTSNDGRHYIFVTKTNANTHDVVYIVKRNGTITSHDIASEANEILGFSGMGNFLIANTKTGLVYYLWDGKDLEYKALNEKPDLGFSFELSGSYRAKTFTKAITVASSSDGGASEEYTTFKGSLPVSHEGEEGKWGLFNKTITASELLDIGVKAGDYYVIENGTSSYLAIQAYGESGDVPRTEIGEKSRPLQLKEEHIAINKACLLGGVYGSGGISGTLSIYTMPEGSSVGGKIVQNTQANYEALFGDVSKYNYDIETTEGKYVRPFFVRYGYRLYDGSVIYQSAPMLMLPNSGLSPIITMASCQISTASYEYQNTIQLSSFVADLMIRPAVGKHSVTEEMDLWKDIIKGVVVAVSQPIDMYKLDWIRSENKNDLELLSYDATKLADICGYVSGAKKKATNEATFTALNPQYIVRAPHLSDAEFAKKVSLISEFYIIKEYSVDEIKSLSTTSFTKVEPYGNGVGGTDVASLPSMQDDYGSWLDAKPEHIFTYNGRLNVANVRYGIVSPFGISSPSLNMGLSLGAKKTRVIVHIKDNGTDLVADSGWQNGYFATRWIFFPHKKAQTFTIYRNEQNVYTKASGSLTEHKLLNGAYHYSNEDLTFASCTDTEANAAYQPESNFVSKANAIYVSEVNNPFYLPLTNSKAVGSGDILAISTSSKALSSGTQFGTYPLYAFCTDGIWPLAVATDGTYDAPNPLSRDVIYNKDGVIGDLCQVDSSVMFPTESGLKVVQGQEIAKASGSMEGYNASELTFLTGMTRNADLIVEETGSISKLVCESHILYDYANSLLHIFPKTPMTNTAGKAKHYVFSLEQKAWSTVVDANGDLRSVVAGYPFSYIQKANGQVMYYSPDEDNDTLRPGVILTRPIAFDSPLGHKVLADLKMIYSSRGTAVCTIKPFASNDGIHWHPLTSLRGGSYKWFRFRIATNLTDLDALTALACMVEDRRNNKLR